MEIYRQSRIRQSHSSCPTLKTLDFSCGDFYKYHSGHHTTWDGEDVFLRSSYELDYAMLLDEKKVHYEVESLRIPYINSQDNKTHIAIPDFYIPEQNLVVEIKSSYTLDVQNMKDKFKEYKRLGYKTKLVLDHKEVDYF